MTETIPSTARAWVYQAPRKLTKEDTDIVALATTREQRVLFRPVSEITGPTVKISEAHFYNENITKESFERCLSCLD